MEKKSILGYWKLLKFETFLKIADKLIYPFGENPIGTLIYLKDGYMSVHIMRRNRKKCLSDDYTNLTMEDKCEIADSYGGYFGQYKIFSDSIVHFPEISSFPNYLDAPQKRFYKIHQNQLILNYSNPIKESSDIAHTQLIWEKN